MTFLEKLRRSIAARDSLVCVGLDPEVERLPEGLPRGPEGVLRFNLEIVAATKDLVCAYKPNLAFYEALGRPGYDVLWETLAAIPRDVLTIADGKRADIGNTSRQYAKALFDVLGFDSATVNPYLGEDALTPFFEHANRGVFVLARTSNPGARDFEELPVVGPNGSRPLYEVVAARVRGWNRNGNAALVVGATVPAELARLRELTPELPFLIPGLGAQGGDLEAAVATSRLEAPAVISASRSILYASSGPDFAEAARRAAREMRDAIRRVGPG